MKIANDNRNYITNIHPTNGVTPNQLFHYAQYLIGPIKTKHQFMKALTEHQIQECVGDTVMNVLKKMDEGKVDKLEFSNFKDYTYMSLLTNLKQKLHRLDTNYNNFNKEAFSNSLDIHNENDEFDILDMVNSEDNSYLQYGEDGETTNEEQLLKKAITLLSQDRQDILTAILSSTTDEKVRPLLRKLNVSNQIYDLIKREIKLNIQDINNGTAKNNELLDMMISTEEFNKLSTDDKIKKALAFNSSPTYVARKLNVTRALVDYHKQKMELPKVNKPKLAPIRRKFLKDDVIRLHNEGYTTTEITKELGCTRTAVYYNLNEKFRLKKSAIAKIKNNKLLTPILKDRLVEITKHNQIKHVDEDIKQTHQTKNKTVRVNSNGQIEHIGEDIKRLRAEGLTYNQIKAKLNCSKSTISYHCNEQSKYNAKNRLTIWRAKQKNN